MLSRYGNNGRKSETPSISELISGQAKSRMRDYKAKNLKDLDKIHDINYEEEITDLNEENTLLRQKLKIMNTHLNRIVEIEMESNYIFFKLFS